MRRLLVAMMMLLGPVTSTQAQVSVGISFPGVSIGINVPTYPELVLVPDYPVYYAPRADWNYFFFDGMYWVYQRDNWYASAWYNGPWYLVGPERDGPTLHPAHPSPLLSSPSRLLPRLAG